MSEKPAEYLKRTCLICGCHTNQTINIYEPRSGPNIVELIQAKFKFQPLNEDKYLCFSCNNWLINWHSLQAVNSNDAESESPSGTFRSHMNSMAPEKGAGSQHQTGVTVAVCRPIAQVRPRQLGDIEDQNEVAEAETETQSAQIPEMLAQLNATAANSKSCNSGSSKTQNYSKRSFRLNHRLRRRIQHRSMRSCCMCGRAIVLRMRANLNTAAMPKKSRKCRKCREVCQWRALTLHSFSLAKAASQKSLQSSAGATRQSLVNTTDTNNVNSQNNAQEHNQSQEQRRPLQRPLVDGKVVSMLRRLGTTLSRDSQHQHHNQQQQQQHSNGSNVDTSATSQRPSLPQIMSPAKQKPRWTRPLEDDEILLDFETAVSEVLPSFAANEQTGQQVRRRLAYQMSSEAPAVVVDISDDDNEEDDEVQAVENLYNWLPKGLSISLV